MSAISRATIALAKRGSSTANSTSLSGYYQQWYRVVTTIPQNISAFSSSHKSKHHHGVNKKASKNNNFRKLQTLRVEAEAAEDLHHHRGDLCLAKPAVRATTSSHPTREELRRVMCHAALPMIGFGFMDQTLMIQAGNAIDCTIGVSLGLSTLVAAAVGSIVSSAGGILFGETLQHVFSKHAHWAAAPQLDPSHTSLAAVQRAKFSGTFWGLMVGLVLGLGNLWLVDTDRSTTLKAIQALSEEEQAMEFAFKIEISNNNTTSPSQQQSTDNVMGSVTTLTMRGPDVDGVLASVVNTLSAEGCSLVNVSARTSPSLGSQGVGVLEDTIVLRRKGRAIPDEELSELAKKVLEATKSPLNVPTLTAKLKEAELEKSELNSRIEKLTDEIVGCQINVKPGGSSRLAT